MQDRNNLIVDVQHGEVSKLCHSQIQTIIVNHKYMASTMPPFFLKITKFFASLKSLSVTFERRLRRAKSPASVHIACEIANKSTNCKLTHSTPTFMSAPVKLSLPSSKASNFTSFDMLIFEAMTSKIRRRVRSSGKGNSIFRSMRPGRISAGSSVSMRLVARMIWKRNEESMRRKTRFYINWTTYLDVSSVVESVQLVQEFEHRSLHLPLTS